MVCRFFEDAVGKFLVIETRYANLGEREGNSHPSVLNLSER